MRRIDNAMHSVRPCDRMHPQELHGGSKMINDMTNARDQARRLYAVADATDNIMSRLEKLRMARDMYERACAEAFGVYMDQRGTIISQTQRIERMQDTIKRLESKLDETLKLYA
jgi:bifunctional ADP-heptose synthase (sugar kinase/adenylyltransferase)